MEVSCDAEPLGRDPLGRFAVDQFTQAFPSAPVRVGDGDRQQHQGRVSCEPLPERLLSEQGDADSHHDCCSDCLHESVPSLASPSDDVEGDDGQGCDC